MLSHSVKITVLMSLLQCSLFYLSL